MRLLLDSHALLWWTTREPAHVGSRLRAAVAAADAMAISVATIWELEIKQAAGKLTIEAGYWARIESSGIELLMITPDDAIAAARLPLLHRDPFDRMIVAQSMRRGLTLATADSALADYGVAILNA